MSFDPSDFLSLAEELAESKKESAWRSALSRAYYCIYHLGFAYAKKHHFTGTGRQIHRDLWKWWTQETNPRPMRCIGNTAGRLLNSRREADYEINNKINHADVIKTIDRAKKMKDAILDLSKVS